MTFRAQLFVGRLPKDIRTRELEEVFSRYGRLTRCDVKSGGGGIMAYAFIDFDDRRDAEDAIKYEDGREMHGRPIVVEWAKGPNYRFRRDGPGGGGGSDRGGGGRGYRDDYRDGRGGGGGGGGRRRSRSRSRSRSPLKRRAKRSRTRSKSRSRGRSDSRSASPASRGGSRGKD